RDQRDVAVFAIITAAVSRDDYVAQVRDFTRWLGAPTRTRFGLFSDPAVAADVDAVTIDSRDVTDLKDCRPGDCKIKLPATEMRRIHEAIDWKAADVQAQVSAYARQRLLDYVTAYRASGDSALVVYDDRGNVPAGEAFAALLRESPYLYAYAPTLHRYLARYPADTLPGLTEVLYWSEDQLPRLRPILSVKHLVLYTPPELAGATIVAEKQIYANHYFEAAFELLTVVDRAPGVYLVLLRRFRFDNLPSGGLVNLRGRVTGKLRDQARADLEREQMRAEHASGR
ncbi:MAG: hypothetical protein ACREMV_12155, partial [Gemmatimonadales bacterium]